MYILFYVRGCIPHIREFKSLAQVYKFIECFDKKYQSNTNDNWIDLLIKGKIEATFEGYEGFEHG